MLGLFTPIVIDNENTVIIGWNILVQANSLKIEMNIKNLCSTLVQVVGIKITPSKETALIIGAYNTRRVKRGALVIEPENPDRDIFDLQPDQLKKLVQGFIWREEHFAGMAIKEIALRENCSQSYVGTAIFSTFEISQTA